MSDFVRDEVIKTLKRKRFYNRILNEILPVAVSSGAAIGSIHYVKTNHNPGEAPKSVQTWESERAALSQLEKIEEKSELLTATEQELRSRVDNPSEEVEAYVSASEKYREITDKASAFGIVSILLGAIWTFGVGLRREGKIQSEISRLEYI